ncbi:hypothetical protein [Treponema primitia]|uniref:hypothetical protein n=1 Tax=Treponema primitia TaxID=88058 RepID=UPI0002555138|nr:hypothetical protein [Treponema primitia]
MRKKFLAGILFFLISVAAFAEGYSFLLLIFQGPRNVVASNYLVDLSLKQEYRVRFRFRIYGLLTEWVKLQPSYTGGTITVKEATLSYSDSSYRVYVDNIERYYIDLSWENSSTITSRIGPFEELLPLVFVDQGKTFLGVDVIRFAIPGQIPIPTDYKEF